MAELTGAQGSAGEGDRPFPPGDYPLLVVGSGPGAIQFSYCLGRLGVEHAVISADPSPGGMFRRWPFFQRLLSWTKPYAPVERGTPAFERYDWNSLLSDDPEHRALMPSFMDGSSEFPSRAEMERNIATFVERTGVRIRYGTRWTSTSRDDDGRFVLETTDGVYRAPVAVFAVGIAQPWMPPTPGLDKCSHYGDTRPAETYAGRRVFIIGKQVSGFELASGLLQWARQIVLASPTSTKLSVNTKSLVGVRARYLQPYEDHVLGGGVTILDAAIDRVDRTEDAFVVHLRRTDGGPDMAIEADDVIAATGFQAPLLDLPDLGVATVGQNRVPAQTPFWESASVPGIHFAGTMTQGSTGMKKHGLPANSGAVHGARYNARVLARHLARKHFGWRPERPEVDPRRLADLMIDELSNSPELFHQRAYLTRVISSDPEGRLFDDGVVPLAWWLDSAEDDGIALTIEADGSGGIFPVVYVRRGGSTEEIDLDPHPMLDFRTEDHRKRLEDVAARIAGSSVR